MSLPSPAAKAVKEITYGDLLGVDWSRIDTEIDRRHAADILNLIPDNGLRKRRGWEVKNSAMTSAIDNMWTFVINGKRFFVVASGTTIQEYKLDTGFTLTSPHTGTKTGRRAGFYMASLEDDVTKQGFYILNGDEYVFCHLSSADATDLTIESASAYVPQVIVSRDPTGSPNAGTVIESINLLTRERKEDFTNTSGNTSFLCTSEIDTSKPYSAQYLDTDGTWKAATISSVSGATVTLSQAHNPPIETEDNIRIQYYATGTDKSSRISQCDIHAIFNQATVDQVFVAGNPEYPHYVWFSGLGDPTYFPDVNYLFVGGSGTSIMGFSTVSSYLAIIKEKSGNDATMYLVYPDDVQYTEVDVTGNTSIQTETVYKTMSATVGEGAINKTCFSTLGDEPLFLSDTGVVAITSANMLSDKTIRERSRFLRGRLLKEPDLESAHATNWNNFYLLCVNSHVYLLDGRQKTSDYSGNTNYNYEAYYWDNVPATCFCTWGDELYFGTADGKICRFKTDIGSDVPDAYNDDGVAITARWASRNDNDDKSTWFKTMLKKGSVATFLPSIRSSADIYYIKDGDPREYLGTLYIDRFVFWDIDFSRISFSGNEDPRDKYFRTKIKKYKRLQLIFENSKLNESFGLVETSKVVEYTRYAK